MLKYSYWFVLIQPPTVCNKFPLIFTLGVNGLSMIDTSVMSEDGSGVLWPVQTPPWLYSTVLCFSACKTKPQIISMASTKLDKSLWFVGSSHHRTMEILMPLKANGDWYLLHITCAQDVGSQRSMFNPGNVFVLNFGQSHFHINAPKQGTSFQGSEQMLLLLWCLWMRWSNPIGIAWDRWQDRIFLAFAKGTST